MDNAMIKDLCTHCDELSDFEVIIKEETINVKNEPIKVNVRYLKCNNCGDETIDSKNDFLLLAYRKYREKHGLLQPEEIKKCRETFNLTQNELAKLLGLGVATISRYENGSLQDTAYDKLLRLAMSSINLYKLIENSENIFPESRKDNLLTSLRGLGQNFFPIEEVLDLKYKDDNPNENNGYKRIDREKLYNCILYFASNGVWKTKLNKLLFYSDFKHFKEYTTSITGVKYAHMQFGPVPEDFELHYSYLTLKGDIEFQEEFFLSGESGEIIKALRQPDLNIFAPSELKIITSIYETFYHYGARELSELSHNEEGYKKTENREKISYEFARELSV